MCRRSTQPTTVDDEEVLNCYTFQMVNEWLEYLEVLDKGLCLPHVAAAPGQLGFKQQGSSEFWANYYLPQSDPGDQAFSVPQDIETGLLFTSLTTNTQRAEALASQSEWRQLSNKFGGESEESLNLAAEFCSFLEVADCIPFPRRDSDRTAKTDPSDPPVTPVSSPMAGPRRKSLVAPMKVRDTTALADNNHSFCGYPLPRV